MGQSKDLHNLTHYVSLARVTCKRAPFRMYSHYYYQGTLFVTFRPVSNIKDVPTPSTKGMTVAIEALNNATKVLLEEECHRLEAMRQLNVEGNLGCIQQHVQR